MLNRIKIGKRAYSHVDGRKKIALDALCSPSCLTNLQIYLSGNFIVSNMPTCQNPLNGVLHVIVPCWFQKKLVAGTEPEYMNNPPPPPPPPLNQRSSAGPVCYKLPLETFCAQCWNVPRFNTVLSSMARRYGRREMFTSISPSQKSVKKIITAIKFQHGSAVFV